MYGWLEISLCHVEFKREQSFWLDKCENDAILIVYWDILDFIGWGFVVKFYSNLLLYSVEGSLFFYAEVGELAREIECLIPVVGDLFKIEWFAVSLFDFDVVVFLLRECGVWEDYVYLLGYEGVGEGEKEGW